MKTKDILEKESQGLNSKNLFFLSGSVKNKHNIAGNWCFEEQALTMPSDVKSNLFANGFVVTNTNIKEQTLPKIPVVDADVKSNLFANGFVVTNNNIRERTLPKIPVVDADVKSNLFANGVVVTNITTIMTFESGEPQHALTKQDGQLDYAFRDSIYPTLPVEYFQTHSKNDDVNNGISAAHLIMDSNCANGDSIFWISEHGNDIEARTTWRQETADAYSEVVRVKMTSGLSIGNGLKIFILACNCLMVILPIGVISVIAILFVNIIDEFKSTRADASPIISVYSAVVYGAGGVLGPLMNRYNGGYMCIIGGMIAFAGFIISCLAPSLPVVIFGIGVLAGFGLAAPLLFPFIIVGELFENNKVTMLAVVAIFPGVAFALFPYITAQLTEAFGWRGVILIYGGLLLNCVPVGLLNAFVKRRMNQKHRNSEMTSWMDSLCISLFKKPEFLVLIFSVFIVNSVFPTINFFFIDMMQDKGFDVATGSLLLTYNGFLNITGRIISVFAAPVLRCSRMSQWMVYLLIMSITISMYVIFDQYEYLLGTTIIHGFFSGMCYVSYPVLILEVSGHTRHTNGMSYCNLIGAIGGLVGGATAGLIKDVTGSYDILYYATTVLGIVASMLLAVILVVTNIKNLQKNKKITEQVNRTFVDRFTYVDT